MHNGRRGDVQRGRGTDSGSSWKRATLEPTRGKRRKEGSRHLPPERPEVHRCIPRLVNSQLHRICVHPVEWSQREVGCGETQHGLRNSYTGETAMQIERSKPPQRGHPADPNGCPRLEGGGPRKGDRRKKKYLRRTKDDGLVRSPAFWKGRS